MELDLKSLGFTKEELQERVIDTICNRLLTRGSADDEGNEVILQSDLEARLQKHIRARVDDSIARLAETYVLPNAAQYVENICLQETNKWGEATGKKMTFIEYLTARAEAYLVEQVSYEGKSKQEAGGYSWSGAQPRITYLVHQHLQYSIAAAMKDALKIANSAIAKGIADTVKIQMEKIVNTLKVGVEFK